MDSQTQIQLRGVGPLAKARANWEHSQVRAGEFPILGDHDRDLNPAWRLRETGVQGAKSQAQIEAKEEGFQATAVTMSDLGRSGKGTFQLVKNHGSERPVSCLPGNSR